MTYSFANKLTERHNRAEPEHIMLRVHAVIGAYEDLLAFGEQQGYSEAVLNNQIELLFETFSGSFFTFILIDSSKLAEAIAADSTIAWLDLDANGQTIRTRLINRLS